MKDKSVGEALEDATNDPLVRSESEWYNSLPENNLREYSCKLSVPGWVILGIFFLILICLLFK